MTGHGRPRSIALLGVGMLVPLLSGGNVLVSLEPDLAIRYLALTVIALAALFLTTEPERTTSIPAVPTIALALLSAWWIATLLLRPFGPRAALEAEGLFCAVLLYTLFAWKPLQGAEIRSWTIGLVTGTLVTAAYGQYQYWIMFPRTAPLILAAGGWPRLYVNANFYNSNCYAAFIAGVVVLAAGFVPGGKSRWEQAGWALVISMLLVTLILSESRATLGLLIPAGAAFAFGMGVPLVTRWTLAALLIALVATASAMLGKVGFEELWHVGWLGRVAIWRGSLRMTSEHWLFGVGLGRFWDYFEQYRINTYYTRYPHNFLLEVFAELGVIGGGALLVYLVSSYARTLRLWLGMAPAFVDSAGLGTATAVVVATGLLILHGLLDIDWHAPANPILLFALLGIGQHLDRFAMPPSFASAAQPRKPGAP